METKAEAGLASLHLKTCLKQGDGLSSLLFISALDYVIMKVPANPGRLEIKWCASVSGSR